MQYSGMTGKSLTELECCVLGVVWREGPCTAYDLRKIFERSLTTSWRASTGSIYPLVRKLEKMGLVTVVAVGASKRNSRSITITKAGLSKVRNWVCDVPDWIGEPLADPIRTRFYFLQTIAKPKREAVLEEWMSLTRAAIEAVEMEIRKFVELEDTIETVSHQGALMQLQARENWLAMLRPYC